MWFVYFIQSMVDNTVYIGYTENIEKRLKEHNQGKTKSIKHKIPFKLIYSEKFWDKTEARKREIELKKNSFKKKTLLNDLREKRILK